MTKTSKTPRESSIDDLFAGAAADFDADFFRTMSAVRPDEIGNPREHRLREFLRSWLPAIYGVSRGYILDVNGKLSRECDVILFDEPRCPKFLMGSSQDARYVPFGNSYGSIEVKSTLGKRELRDALEKLQSVRALSSKQERTIPIGIVFAYKFARGFDFNVAEEMCNEMKQFPDAIVVLDSGISFPPTTDAMKRYKSIHSGAPAGGHSLDPEVVGLGLSVGLRENFGFGRYRKISYLVETSENKGLILLLFYALLVDLLGAQKIVNWVPMDLISVWRKRRQ